ncbi:MAG TPA: hypothetical protein VK509_07820 [Polyangiales bacterium]|nr:hypothetical protein [Polyangiales bacterium]
MSATRAWLATQLGEQARPSLDLALLTDRGARYVSSRASLVGVRAVLRVAVHAAELTFLGEMFPLEFLLPLFVLRALPGLLSGLCWGALEALRARVRLEVAHGSRQLAAIVTEGYLVCAGALGALLLATVGALTGVQDDPLAEPLGLYGLFAIVSALALAIDLWTRTFHAGVFALGRVYRPVWTLFAPDLLELAVIIGAWPWLGPFGLHAAVLLGACVRGAVALVYARRAYRARRLDVPRVFRPRALARLSASDFGHAIEHALATLPLQLDRLLLLALLNAPASPGALALGVPYYALRPLAAFSQSWARGFYSDFVQLDHAGVGVLRARFERLLARASLATGAISALALAAGAWLLFGEEGLIASAWLVPLALVRARFTLEQVRGFAYGAHGALALTGVALLLGLLAAALTGLSDRALLGVVLLALLAALWPAQRIASQARARHLLRVARLPPSAWLHVVGAQSSPLRISVARVDARIATLGAAGRVLGPLLAEHGHLVRFGRSWLMWWEPRDHARSPAELGRALAGALVELRSVDGDDGRSALEAACRARLVPDQLAAALAAPRPADPLAELRADVAQLLPEAEAVELRSRGLRALTPAQLTAVRQAIASGAREQQTTPRHAAHQVAVYAPGGEPELIFVWPTSAGRGGELRRRVQHASWRASVGW